MKALLKYGVTRVLADWIIRTLKGRKFYVKLEDTLSEPVFPTSGLLQGSSLSCLVFNLVVNDVTDLMSEEDKTGTGYADRVVVFGFADDLKVMADISSKKGQKKMTEVCNRMCEWAKDHSYFLHLGKTNWIRISKNPNPAKYELVMGGVKIDRVDRARDLGVIQNSKNTNDDH